MNKIPYFVSSSFSCCFIENSFVRLAITVSKTLGLAGDFTGKMIEEDKYMYY